MGTTAIVILIIYIVGVVINALVVASIWDDLTTDERLVKVRRGVLVFVVICSVLTWVYALGYFLVYICKAIFKRGGQP
jgi:hypothetical protein